MSASDFCQVTVVIGPKYCTVLFDITIKIYGNLFYFLLKTGKPFYLAILTMHDWLVALYLALLPKQTCDPPVENTAIEQQFNTMFFLRSM